VAHPNNEVAGKSHMAFVRTNEPYYIIYWFINDEFKYWNWGYGLPYAWFTYHTNKNDGSTTGRKHKIEALAYSQDGSYDRASYTVTVWSNLKHVSTPYRSESVKMKVGNSYSLSFSMSTPNSNYRITGAKVWVNGSLVASKTYSDVASATITAPGNLGTNVGQAVILQVEWYWRVAISAAVYVARYTWNAVVRCKIYGTCTCAVDNNYLDSGYFQY